MPKVMPGAVLVGVAVIAVAGAARAGGDCLDKAIAAYNALDYEAVTPLVQEALPACGESSDRVKAYELLATMHVMFGQSGDAEAAFLELLRLKADYVLPGNSSPKLHAALSAARDRAASGPTPVMASNPAARDGALAAKSGAEAGGPFAAATVEPAPPFYGRWWFWTGIGVIVAGGIFWGVWQAQHPELPETDYGPFKM
ncbi:MAG: hypothetical protein HY903_09435 [Deltaproteobacteria bacterium]|nr:hypothetical protein [Deltaproteobacteria bacterium]